MSQALTEESKAGARNYEDAVQAWTTFFQEAKDTFHMVADAKAEKGHWRGILFKPNSGD